MFGLKTTNFLCKILTWFFLFKKGVADLCVAVIGVYCKSRFVISYAQINQQRSKSAIKKVVVS